MDEEEKRFLIGLRDTLWRTHEMCDELDSGGDFDEKLTSQIYKNVCNVWKLVLKRLRKAGFDKDV